MSAHPSEEMLTELAFGEGSAEASEHVASCAACAARLAEARGLLDDLGGVPVPEPSPLFWQAFRRNVSRRISEDRPRPAWRAWSLPMAIAATLLVVAVAWRVPQPSLRGPQLVTTSSLAGTPAAASQGAAPAWSPLPPLEQDQDLPVLEGLVVSGAELDDDRGLAAYVAGLSDEEQATLTRALRANGNGGAL